MTGKPNQGVIDWFVSAAAVGKIADVERFLKTYPAHVDAHNSLDGSTALCEAAGRGSFEMVKLLLDAGADIEAQDGAGWTPIDYVKMRTDKTIVDLLLKTQEERRRAAEAKVFERKIKKISSSPSPFKRRGKK